MLKDKEVIARRTFRCRSWLAQRLEAPELPTVDMLKGSELPLEEIHTCMISLLEFPILDEMDTYLWNQEQKDLVRFFMTESNRLANSAVTSKDWHKMVLALNSAGMAKVALRLLHDSESFVDWVDNARKHEDVLAGSDYALLQYIEAGAKLATERVVEASKLVGSDLEQSRQLFQDACDLIEGQHEPYQQFYAK